MSEELMSPDDLHELTGFKQREKQREALEEMGIPFRLAAGRLVVSRVHVRDWIAGVQLRQPVKPRLDLVK